MLLTACGISERQLENLPIVISQTESQIVDINQVISNAQEEVQKALPDAYLIFFSFVGQCTNLPKLQGEIRLDFAHIQRSVFGDRSFLGRATIHTFDQTLSFDVKDETEHYPNMEPLALDGNGTQEIANILHDHLVSKNSCIDTIVLSRVSTESPWLVRCGPPDEVFLECVEIDPENGKITELQ